MLFAAKKTFHGGVHPDHEKELSRYYKIEPLPAPAEIILPLSQHIGARAKPMVEIGDIISLGQKVGAADGYVSANVHSPVSGRVIAIEPRLHPSGVMANSIVIENDFQNQVHEDVKPKGSLENLSAKEIIEAIREAGIVGMGGAAFPTHVKLSPPEDKQIKTCIINGVECEPYLTSDHRVMLETPELLIMGLRAIMKVVGAKEGIIAIEDNKPDAIETITAYAKPIDYIKVVALKTKYPQGGEKQLIQSLFGVSLPARKLPMDVGCLVTNVDTACNIANTLSTGLPLISRVVTVSGRAVNHPRNFRVPIGTSVSYVLEKAGGLKSHPARLILGGPMMGHSQCSTEIPIIKGTGAVLALTEEEIDETPSTHCIKCGRCTFSCPVNLEPHKIYAYSKINNREMCKSLNVQDCIECGCCTYGCPAKLELMQYIRLAKRDK